MEKENKIFIGVVAVLIAAMVYTYSANTIKNITGEPISNINDMSFENWITDYSLTYWNMDRRGLSSSVISKSAEHRLGGGYSTVKIDLSSLTSDSSNGILVKKDGTKSITELSPNTYYAFSVSAYEETPNTAGAFIKFGNWASGKYHDFCTRFAIGYNAVKITCRGKSDSYTTAIVGLTVKKAGARVWFDHSQFYLSPCFDTDEGYMYLKKGTCRDSTGQTKTDSCSGTTLTEWYCSGVDCISQSINCALNMTITSCSNGACI